MSAGKLRIFPLNTVLFPGSALNLHVFEPRYKQMISECLDGGEAFGVCLIRQGDEAGDPAVEPHDVGTTAEIGDVVLLPLGRFNISTTGKRRFRIVNVLSRDPYLLCDVEYLEDGDDSDPSGVVSLSEQLRTEFREYLRLLVAYSGTRIEIEIPGDAVKASYVIGDALQVADSIKQQLLEIDDIQQRLRVELDFLRRLLPQLRSLLERRDRPQAAPAAAAAERHEPQGGTARAQQERFFGKFFSQN